MVLVSPWVPLSSGRGSAGCNRMARLPGFLHGAIGSALSRSVPQYIGCAVLHGAKPQLGAVIGAERCPLVAVTLKIRTCHLPNRVEGIRSRY